MKNADKIKPQWTPAIDRGLVEWFPELPQTIADMERALDRFAKAEAKYKAEAKRIVQAGLKKAPANRIAEVAGLAYWFADTLPGVIAEVLNISAQKVTKLAAGAFTVGKCKDCGGELTVTKTYGEPQCKACAKAHAHANWQTHKLRQQAQEVRTGELKAMSYAEYLRTPEWQETRKAALKRARYACQLCNNTGTQLDVHHRTYERRGEEYASDTIVICHDCHGKHHDKLETTRTAEASQ